MFLAIETERSFMSNRCLSGT